MELANQEYTIEFVSNDDSFDPTPKLKSSPIPIKFISFNENDINCFYCKNPYTETLLFKQRYCEKCLLQYVTYFKQIINNSYRNDRLVSDIEKNCKLCGNLIYQDSGIIICSDFYKISTGWIESTLTKSSIQILHLPWWDTHSLCITCCEVLLFTFDCQKWRLLSLEWISYSKIRIDRKIAQGGFGIIYQAIWFKSRKWLNIEFAETEIKVAVKKFPSSKNITKSFLNELKSYYQLCEDFRFIIKCHGITKDPTTDEYMIVMNYADGGNLHNYLHNNFQSITWKEKFSVLFQISDGGNILLTAQDSWKIGDFGLSQPAYNTTINNEIYGVIPYIAPEIFHGAKFSKASDIYSLGMIMWELTSGCKPFADVEHDISLICKIIDGKRPEITNDTPECFANLMKRCWDPNPSKRPYTSEILDTIWKISRPLRSLTSKSLSINTLSFNINPDYTSKEYDLDINDIQSSSSHNKNFAIQNSSNSQHPGAIYTSRPLKSLIFKPLKELDEKSNIEEYISKEYEFDINDVQSPSSKVISTIKSQLQKKRNIEELNIIPQTKGKHIKTQI
ncbi:kinase-like domain-containing protein [Rhizophagus clarus]|uniref:Kinase-like domain-containing protein n=1 Tax=Rhizophagus clarus TaxID=94130 RepID=A0A8H3QDB8_9GLOM|nr:kinase-like domain-containing protein [Rhizophagus clarus]